MSAPSVPANSRGPPCSLAREGGNYLDLTHRKRGINHLSPTREGIKLWRWGCPRPVKPTSTPLPSSMCKGNCRVRRPPAPALPSSQHWYHGNPPSPATLDGAILVSACHRRARPASIWKPGSASAGARGREDIPDQNTDDGERWVFDRPEMVPNILKLIARACS